MLDTLSRALVWADSHGLTVPEASAITTYYYRTSGGTRGSTTDAGSIPAGAVVERVT